MEVGWGYGERWKKQEEGKEWELGLACKMRKDIVSNKLKQKRFTEEKTIYKNAYDTYK